MGCEDCFRFSWLLVWINSFRRIKNRHAGFSIGCPVGSPVNAQPAEYQPDNVFHAILIGAACLHCNPETGQGYPKMRRIVPQHSTPQREVQSWWEEKRTFRRKAERSSLAADALGLSYGTLGVYHGKL